MESHNFNLYIDSSSFHTKPIKQIKKSAIEICTVLSDALRATENINKILKENETKPFDWELYKRHNERAVNALEIKYKSMGYKVYREPFGRYGIDLMIIDKYGIKWYLEPEIITAWDREDTTKYRYTDLHILSRKWHHRDLERSFNVTVHSKLLFAYLTPYKCCTDIFLDAHIEKVPNSYCPDPEGEWMCNINWKQQSKLLVF